MKVIDRQVRIAEVPEIFGCVEGVNCDLTLISESALTSTYKVIINTNSLPITNLHIKWRLPCIGVKGIWSSNAGMDKRVHADWEDSQVKSRISVDAPVLTVYDHDDQNVVTIGFSDFIYTTHLEASIQEEDGCIHCLIKPLVEEIDIPEIYEAHLIVIKDKVSYIEALSQVALWWKEDLNVANQPMSSRVPLYSTWYSYHQNFTAGELLDECRAAKKLGFSGIIIDDGWQTRDIGRGYDYTGDWEVERIEDVRSFVASIHDMDMFCMFWFSVPFCGVKSKAYQRFKGKFLTENHHWAPVFDPRYPEVREYLISRYVEAVRDWGIDGLKLDFIDDFKVYEETDTTPGNGKDCTSVNRGVQYLIDEIRAALYAINPNILIEFRQKYIGPYLWTLGNMFRAFDCPYDSTNNRVRTTDVRLLSGGSTVHSDMIAWHHDEQVEQAALQLTNILFSVPQLSVKLAEVSEDHRQMIMHWTQYWNDNANILLSDSFKPQKPSSNYPIISTASRDKTIIGIYDDVVIHLPESPRRIDIVNGKMSEDVVILVAGQSRQAKLICKTCKGEIVTQSHIVLSEMSVLKVPANGLIELYL